MLFEILAEINEVPTLSVKGYIPAGNVIIMESIAYQPMIKDISIVQENQSEIEFVLRNLDAINRNNLIKTIITSKKFYLNNIIYAPDDKFIFDWV